MPGHWPLRLRLPIYALLAVALTGAAIALLVSQVGGRAIRGQVEAQLAGSASVYADAIRVRVLGARALLETMMAEPGFHALARRGSGGVGAGELAHLQEQAERLTSGSELLEQVVLLGPDGDVRLLAPAADLPRLSRRNLAFAAWFREALGQGSTIVSDLVISPITQRPTVVIATPLYDPRGRFTGVLAGMLGIGRLSGMGNVREDIRQQYRYGYVTDRRGLVIAHQGRPGFADRQTDFLGVPGVGAAVRGESGVARYVNPIEGEEKLAAFTPLPGVGWAVVYEVPAREALGGLRRLTGAVLAVSLVVAGIFGAIGWAVAGRVTRPLSGLVEATEQIRGGDLSRRVPVGRRDEIGRLGDTFNTMVEALAEKEARLREHAAELERRVAERTAALQESQRQLATLVDNLPGAAYRCANDPQWSMEYISGGIEGLTGYPCADFLGNRVRSYESVIHPEDRQAVWESVQGGIAARAPYQMEYRLLSAAGEARWVWERGGGVFAEDGSLVALEGFIADITERKRAERGLAESRQLLQAVLDNIPQRVFWKDRDGRFLGCNCAFAWDAGLTDPGEVVGKDDFALAGRAEAERYRADDRQVLESGFPRIGDEVPQQRPDGSRVWLRISKLPLRDAAGRVIGVLGTYEDITAQRRLQVALLESEAALRGMINAISEAVLLLDAGGTVLVANQTTAERLGQSVEEVEGSSIFAHLSPEVADFRRERMGEAVRTGTVVTFEDQRAGRWIESRVYPMRDGDGQVTRLAIFGRDVTEQKRAAEALERYSGELARSNRDLEQFAYVASHDLQEPLRMVGSYVQLLARRLGDRLDGELREYMDFAVDGARRMQRLINDLLDFSRIGTRGALHEPVAVSGVVDGVVERLRMAIEEAGGEVSRDPLPTVLADPLQLDRLFQNLLANALKFRGERPPRVHVTAAREGAEWVFTVRDNGIGFDPRYAERVFVIFQRLHGREEYPGTGMGLAICKRIVERHGGRIWVESVPGEGSTFRFTLPAAGGGSGAAQPAEA